MELLLLLLKDSEGIITNQILKVIIYFLYYHSFYPYACLLWYPSVLPFPSIII